MSDILLLGTGLVVGSVISFAVAAGFYWFDRAASRKRTPRLLKPGAPPLVLVPQTPRGDDNALLLGSWVRKVERRQGYAVLTTVRDAEFWLDPPAVHLANVALGTPARREVKR